MILRRDPCGVLCALLSYVAMIYADYVVINWLVTPTFSQSIWGVIHVVLFNTVLLLAFIAHFRAMVTDPGIVPINKNAMINRRSIDSHLYGHSTNSFSENDDSDSGTDIMMLKPKYVGEDWSICTRCESYRPPRAHHCRVCRRCVRKMDHHCKLIHHYYYHYCCCFCYYVFLSRRIHSFPGPWVNNCVGEFNQKYFLQFLLYVGLASSYALGLVIAAWVYHDRQDNISTTRELYTQSTQHARILHTIFVSIESALFGLFVCAVSCDQAVQRGSSRLKKVVKRSKKNLLGEVCGTERMISDSIVMWFLPCSSMRFEREVVQFAHNSQFDV
ncbi:unnamed protein product [Anisakis simplex]|uniref:Palmitoyltransferase n=1 Tax=Anisakis simplex TaxID=6269 RepID=A0A0M3JT91_ANISI|nr:unnamed protein product [Anisakis simplex]